VARVPASVKVLPGTGTNCQSKLADEANTRTPAVPEFRTRLVVAGVVNP
jgi:hypothetical protein